MTPREKKHGTPEATEEGARIVTFIWLIVWLIAGTPDVNAWGDWNNWGIALFVCLALDLLGVIGANSRRSR